jgi:hypothetical protein
MLDYVPILVNAMSRTRQRNVAHPMERRTTNVVMGLVHFGPQSQPLCAHFSSLQKWMDVHHEWYAWQHAKS